MSSSSFLDSYELRKQEIFIINPTHFWAYFSKLKFSVTRIREKPTKPIKILEKWQNMSRMSPSSFLNSFQVPKRQIFFVFNPNPFLLTF